MLEPDVLNAVLIAPREFSLYPLEISDQDYK